MLRAAIASVGVRLCTVPHGMIGMGTRSSSRTSWVAPGPLWRSLAIVVSFGRHPGVPWLGWRARPRIGAGSRQALASAQLG